MKHDYSPVVNNFLPGQCQPSLPYQTPPANAQRNSFCLKWLYGTTVSRCYGCQGQIQNPPSTINEAFIVVYRDRRWYFKDGNWHLSMNEENVHFHLKSSCILTRYPTFLPRTLVIPPEFYAHLNSEHKTILMNEFTIPL